MLFRADPMYVRRPRGWDVDFILPKNVTSDFDSESVKGETMN